MKKEVINVPGRKAVAHLSRAVRFGNLVFVAGTTGRDPATNEMPADVQGQTTIALENIKAALEAAGASLKDVLKTTCYLADMADKKGFDEVYLTYFTSEPPARACFAVGSLGAGVKIEIESIAGIPD